MSRNLTAKVSNTAAENSLSDFSHPATKAIIFSLIKFGETLALQHELILILDFGSQYTQLIARRVREQGVYCEIVPFHYPLEKIVERKPKGVILSGGPNSVYEPDAPTVSPDFYDSINVPLLGICYGMQLLAKDLDGQVEPSAKREYGRARLNVTNAQAKLFRDIQDEIEVWMSHGDNVVAVPSGFEIVARSDGAITA